MKKITGKALSLVLSLALVVSSFSGTFASAASKTINGSLGDDEYDDTIYLVNGGTGAGLTLPNFGALISDSEDGAGALKTDRHEEASDVKITSISHASGDRLVKWYDTKDSGSIDSDTDADDVGLELRNDSVSGEEVLKVLYKGTWVADDDDETEYTVKATQTVTIHVYDKYQTVVGLAATAGLSNEEGELDDDFAQKILSHEIDSGTYPTDTKNLAVLRAIPASADNAFVSWEKLSTIGEDEVDADHFDPDDETPTTPYYYVLKSSSDNLELESKSDGTVDAKVADDAGTGSLTLTAEVTEWGKNQDDGDESYLYDTKDVKEKTAVTKTLLVDESQPVGTNFTHFTKYSGSSYLAKTASLDSDTYNDADTAIKINGYEVKFDASSTTAPALTVTDNASVEKISGDVKSLTVSEGNVSEIDLEDSAYTTPVVSVDEAKVGSIDVKDDASGTVKVTSPKAVVTGNIEASVVDVTSGKTGNINAATVSIEAQDDDSTVSVGEVKATNLTIDSQDSAITIDKLISKEKDATVELSGSDVTIKAIDFNYYNTAFEFSDFQGTIPAPAKADVEGTSLTTTDSNDKVTVTGDADLGGISIEDESQITFTGKVTVTDLDGSGTLVVGLDKLYVTGSASSVILKLSDTFKAGDTAFTAVSDTVDEEDLETYGFTVTRSEGSSKDTFKVADVSFVGLTIAPANTQIAKGYSQTFTASAYAPGTSIPAGYKVQFSLDGANDTLELVDNEDGTATVKAVDYDESFDSENKATLIAELVDEDGDVADDYEAGEADVSAVLVPPVVSDTTSNFSIAPGASYTFKITSPTAPVLTAGTPGVFSVTNVGYSGNDYFIKITAIGKVGSEAGIYVNGTKLLVASIKSDIKSDTNVDITVKKGASYTYKITTSTAPTFGIGTGGVFTYKLTGHSGNDYFYQITAVGSVGAKAGIYVNGQKINAATIG